MASLHTMAAGIRAAAADRAAGTTKPLYRQGLEMLALWRSKRLTPGEYLSYGLGLRDRPASAAEEYVSNHWHWHEQVPRLNDSRFVWVLRNKWLFDRFFRSHGTPLPRTFGLFHPRVGHTPSGTPFTDIALLAEALRTSPTGIVVKPVDGFQGDGVLVLTDVQGDAGNPIFRTADGQVLVGRDLVERAFSTERSPPLIVQERIENHPAVAMISPGATSTVRILTLRTPGQEVLMPIAAARSDKTAPQSTITAPAE